MIENNWITLVKPNKVDYKISDNKKNSLSEIKGKQLKENLKILGFNNESDFWTA